VTEEAAARTLTVRRELTCSQEDLFEAWTDADALATWFGGPAAKTLSVAVDPHVGGAYRMTMQRDGEVGAVEGVYLEVEPPERLVFTWRWDRPEIEDRRESVVTVEFIDRDGSTEVVITHDGIKTESSFAFHVAGWTTVMERLEPYLAGTLS
jgi:uncharacterized protein YndB with AHSA1/START domain